VSTYRQDERRVYQVSDWLQHRWLDHGFGTRHSDGWVDSPAATLKQIHSDTVVRVDDERGCLGHGDALITNRPGVHLTIRTADCMPILVVDPVRRAVAAVHAGWRGTASSIAAKAVARMQSEFGSVPAELQAAIGPGIGVCCYEVGPDVAAQFAAWCPEFEGIGEPVRVDLLEVNRRQLDTAGVGRIIAASRCTRCDSDEFHSFRRDRDLSGRMVSAIAINADAA
jgi:polyphenol oxidase